MMMIIIITIIIIIIIITFNIMIFRSYQNLNIT